MVIRKIDYNSYYTARVRHCPDGDIQDLIIKPTWVSYYDMRYLVLNYSGDNRAFEYCLSEDAYFRILKRYYDDGINHEPDILYRSGYYYFVRVQHKRNGSLHTAVIRVLDVSVYDFEYEVLNYSFENRFLYSKDFRFEYIDCISDVNIFDMDLRGGIKNER